MRIWQTDSEKAVDADVTCSCSRTVCSAYAIAHAASETDAFPRSAASSSDVLGASGMADASGTAVATPTAPTTTPSATPAEASVDAPTARSVGAYMPPSASPIGSATCTP